MIRQANLVDALESLKSFLDEYVISESNPNGLFNSVDINTIGSGDDVFESLTCTCGDPSSTVLSFSKSNGGWDVTAYISTSNNIYLTLKSSTASTGTTLVNKMDYAYGTDNGFLLHFTYDAINGDPNLFATILVARSKDSYPIVVLPAISSDPTNNDYTHLFANVTHYPDTNSLSLGMTQIDTIMQTEAAPFVAYGDQVNLSYTPNAFWMPVSNAYASGFCRMRFNETDCVTNGYWFIDDVTEEGDSDGN